MTEAPVATDYTYAFIRASLGDGAQCILEIGCGDGKLAQRLQHDGFEVIAIDADEACVAAANLQGVNARHAEWPAEIDGQFDAVLFTRSLHHVEDLHGGIAAAQRALAPGGRLIVEDFCAEGGSARSSDWYHAMVIELSDSGALADGASVEALLDKLPPASHGSHDLHSSVAIAASLNRDFDVVETDAAYYFRYLEPHMRDAGAAKWLLEIELEQIAAGYVDALGKRFVAEPK